MNATILQFRRQGESASLPSLEEMCATLRRKYAAMDEIDKSFFLVIEKANAHGVRAKIETIIECRAIAWSMLNRYGITA